MFIVGGSDPLAFGPTITRVLSQYSGMMGGARHLDIALVNGWMLYRIYIYASTKWMTQTISIVICELHRLASSYLNLSSNLQYLKVYIYFRHRIVFYQSNIIFTHKDNRNEILQSARVRPRKWSTKAGRFISNFA